MARENGSNYRQFNEEKTAIRAFPQTRLWKSSISITEVTAINAFRHTPSNSNLLAFFYKCGTVNLCNSQGCSTLIHRTHFTHFTNTLISNVGVFVGEGLAHQRRTIVVIFCVGNICHNLPYRLIPISIIWLKYFWNYQRKQQKDI